MSRSGALPWGSATHNQCKQGEWMTLEPLGLTHVSQCPMQASGGLRRGSELCALKDSPANGSSSEETSLGSRNRPGPPRRDGFGHVREFGERQPRRRRCTAPSQASSGRSWFCSQCRSPARGRKSMRSQLLLPPRS
ncbi:hypothetical protein H920_18980 [Fukomys damarensis]|uniref:Uncharacterized protein n=1 Tax=Fukomys damarensis TaxID=885580 RepID=A0A091CLL9_FUKDA|nr:hypothetical protein H920_18980 [Fukomys damarensis]